ncbi:MAG: hypothetical protein NT072_12910 [Deltaproteobacteria bacterium]|nr:hypothetical protein [Deltaproteobacteria bacterium]
MKKIILIVAFLLMLPGPALSKSPLPDDLLALITGQMGKSPERDEAFMTAAPPGATGISAQTPSTTAGKTTMNAGRDHLVVCPRGSGISIYVIDLLFDVYIGNIAWGDTDSSM